MMYYNVSLAHEPEQGESAPQDHAVADPRPARKSGGLLASILMVAGALIIVFGVCDTVRAPFVFPQQAALIELLIGIVLLVGGAIARR
jgi:hypothetical protein